VAVRAAPSTVPAESQDDVLVTLVEALRAGVRRLWPEPMIMQEPQAGGIRVEGSEELVDMRL
jgi:hypothetical protein